MKKEIAKIVYSFDFGKLVDRTKAPHTLGIFDVDFKKSDAPNPDARDWTYVGTEKTIEKARKSALKVKKIQSKVETRIVNAETGEVLEKI